MADEELRIARLEREIAELRRILMRHGNRHETAKAQDPISIATSSHARLHALSSTSDHSGALGTGQHGDRSAEGASTMHDVAQIQGVAGGTHGESQHTGDVIPAANQDFGAFYADWSYIPTPATPASGVRRLFMHLDDSRLKVIGADGSVRVLEFSGEFFFPFGSSLEGQSKP